MEDYSANTRKTADISQPPAEKRAEKVITGEARVKKKSGFDKAIRAFPMRSRTSSLIFGESSLSPM